MRKGVLLMSSEMKSEIARRPRLPGNEQLMQVHLTQKSWCLN